MRNKYMVSKKDIALLKRSLSYCKKYKLKFSMLLISILSIIILSIIQPLFLGKIIEDISKEKYGEIFYYIALLGIIYIGQCIVLFTKAYLHSTLSNNIIYDLKKEMYNKILNLSMSVFDKMTIGEFISRLQGDVNVLADIITNHLVNIIVDIIKVLILGVVIFSINPTLSFIVLLAFPLNYALFLMFGKKLRKENKEFKQINDRYFSIIQESFSAIKHIKTFGIKDSNFENFNKISLKLKNRQIRIVLLNSLSEVISMLINYADSIIVIGFSTYFIMNGKLSIQFFIAFISYSIQFSQTFNSITKLNSNIQQVLVSLERVFSLLDGLDFSNETFGSKEIERVNGDIEFRDISFSYDNKKLVLDKTSFKINKNKLVAIVGENGCGKSTIINLLLGLYKANYGEILIDEFEISEISEKSLRNIISVVHQKTFIFNLSIKENFQLISPNINMNEIEKACKSVFIHDYIKSLESGYDTKIKENANNLSGGQQQRLALAMCLARNTPILLLDEVTSALDSDSKIILDNVIKSISKNKTIIIITHNILTILASDEVIVIDEGKVIGQGTHKELIASNKKYIDLYKNELICFSKVCNEVEDYEKYNESR